MLASLENGRETGGPDNVESLWLYVDGKWKANRCILKDCSR
jgi:hypothetical protein